MPTTILHNETLAQARARRFLEEMPSEAAIEANNIALEINQLKINSMVWLHNYKQFKRHAYLLHACAATRRAIQLHTRINTRRNK